jgi:pyroglutamyl-peptidase
LPALRAAIRRHRPQVVLCLGLAGSRSTISLERVAVNLCDARIADNAGAMPAGTPVVAGGPAAYFSRLPVKALQQRLLAADLPAELSLSAGSFVCNQVFYGLLHALRRQPAVQAGFIHLPPLPAQAAAHPGSRPLALAEQVRGLSEVVDALVQGIPELQVPAGQTD